MKVSKLAQKYHYWFKFQNIPILFKRWFEFFSLNPFATSPSNILNNLWQCLIDLKKWIQFWKKILNHCLLLSNNNLSGLIKYWVNLEALNLFNDNTMQVWLFVLTFAGFSLVSVKCASIPEQMMSNSKDSGLNPGGMGLPGKLKLAGIQA